VKQVLLKLLEYASRKFVLALACLGGGFYLILQDKDIGGFVALAGVVLGFYNGANVAQDYVNYRKEKKENDSNSNQG
jgi:hypothetical protein